MSRSCALIQQRLLDLTGSLLIFSFLYSSEMIMLQCASTCAPGLHRPSMQPSATVIAQDFVSVFVFTHVCRELIPGTILPLFLYPAPSFLSFISSSLFIFYMHWPSSVLSYIRLLGPIHCHLRSRKSEAQGVARQSLYSE